MALNVENGTGLQDAESYVSVEEANAYHEKMGNAEWSSLDEITKEAMLRRATRYLDGIYGTRANGERVSPQQALVFPRRKATYIDGTEIGEGIIPPVYKDAECEVALMASQGTALAVSVATGPRIKRDKVDVIETEYFEEGYDAAPVFGWVDTILTPLFGPRAEDGAIQVIGVSRA